MKDITTATVPATANERLLFTENRAGERATAHDTISDRADYKYTLAYSLSGRGELHPDAYDVASGRYPSGFGNPQAHTWCSSVKYGQGWQRLSVFSNNRSIPSAQVCRSVSSSSTRSISARATCNRRPCPLISKRCGADSISVPSGKTHRTSSPARRSSSTKLSEDSVTVKTSTSAMSPAHCVGCSG